MAENLRLLIVGAHPADVFDQSGGTMAHHVSRGDYVGCVVLTHGARVHDKVMADRMFHRKEVPGADELKNLMKERADVKTAEVREACQILGVEDLYFLGADDAVLLVTEENVRSLARLIREIKPDIVITQFPKEMDGVANPHAITGQIVLHALTLAAGVDPGDRHPPHRIGQVFYMGMGAATIPRMVWDAEGGYYNDVFIDITDVIEKKLAAMDCLMSQGYAGAYVRKRIETSDGAFGMYANCAYAEGFIKQHAETHYYLPLSDNAFETARMSDHELIAKKSYRLPVD